ncbi:MAG: hypothetical protein L3K14_05260 [Thermoplasmata archaeon]|nr:hypothetical protein [Thermoplasmata archaeon]
MNAAARDAGHGGKPEAPGPPPSAGLRRFSLDRPGRPCVLVLGAILAVFLLNLQGEASAATSVTPQSPDPYSVTQVGAPPGAPTTLRATVVVRATAALAGLPAAGTQRAGTAGVAGVPRALPTCRVAACLDRYVVASPAGLIVRDFAERVTFTLPQPQAPPGTSTGFMVEILIHTTAGWTSGRAYLATGTTPRAATITLQLFVDLGTQVAPTILSVQTTVDTCSAATSCP